MKTGNWRKRPDDTPCLNGMNRVVPAGAALSVFAIHLLTKIQVSGTHALPAPEGPALYHNCQLL